MVEVGISHSKLFLSLTVVLGLTIIGFPSASAQITNGDFETGDLSDWTLVSGSVGSAISTLGPAGSFTPISPEGSFMAFIDTAGSASTGAFASPDATTGSILSQTFTIPAGADTLDFCYLYVSNDSAGFENFFLAQLTSGDSTFILATADNAGGSPAGGIFTPPPPVVDPLVTLTPAIAPIFLSGVNILGSGLFIIPSSLMHVPACSSFDIPDGIKGDTATLTFVASDALDTAFSSAVVIDCVGFDVTDVTCITVTTRGSGGTTWEDPSLGPDSGGIVKVNKGICINITCWDVTQNYHVDFELYEMLTGTNTISLTIWCPHGVATCNYVGLGITPPNERPSSAIWSIAIEKDSSGEWKLTKDDSEGRLGNITFTVQEVGTEFLTVSFTIDFKNLSTDKMWLWVELRDTNRGVNLFFFNDGVKFIDIDAYPEVQTAFEPSLKLEPICLNEDPNYRNSCAFAKIRERAIQIAEETLWQIMNN